MHDAVVFGTPSVVAVCTGVGGVGENIAELVRVFGCYAKQNAIVSNNKNSVAGARSNL